MYAYLQIPEFSRQEERAIMAVVNGNSVSSAARHAGMSPKTLKALLEEDRAHRVLDYFSERNKKKVEVTKEVITNMFFESYHMAATAGEKVAATKELARLHDLYDEKQNDRAARGSGTSININTQNNTQNNISFTSKQIEKMPTEQLLVLAKKHFDKIPGVTLGDVQLPPPPGYDAELDV